MSYRLCGNCDVVVDNKCWGSDYCPHCKSSEWVFPDDDPRNWDDLYKKQQADFYKELGIKKEKNMDKLKEIDRVMEEIDKEIFELLEEKSRLNHLRRNPNNFVCGWGNYGESFLILTVGDKVVTKYGDHGEITAINTQRDIVRLDSDEQFSVERITGKY